MSAKIDCAIAQKMGVLDKYSQSLDACRPVIERLKEEGWTEGSLLWEPGNYLCWFGNKKTHDCIEAYAETDALAICLAALRVWGIDPETLK